MLHNKHWCEFGKKKEEKSPHNQKENQRAPFFSILFIFPFSFFLVPFPFPLFPFPLPFPSCFLSTRNSRPEEKGLLRGWQEYHESIETKKEKKKKEKNKKEKEKEREREREKRDTHIHTHIHTDDPRLTRMFPSLYHYSDTRDAKPVRTAPTRQVRRWTQPAESQEVTAQRRRLVRIRTFPNMTHVHV